MKPFCLPTRDLFNKQVCFKVMCGQYHEMKQKCGEMFHKTLNTSLSRPNKTLNTSLSISNLILAPKAFIPMRPKMPVPVFQNLQAPAFTSSDSSSASTSSDSSSASTSSDSSLPSSAASTAGFSHY